MLKSALIAATVLALAVPGLASAKGAKKAAEDSTAGLPTGPVAYSDLAAADAKMNGPAPAAHKAAKKKSSTAASADTSGGAAAMPAQ
jgi:hypothetical protein